MYGQCENCGRNNYLAEFSVTDSIKKYLCHICFKLFAEGKIKAQIEQFKCDLKKDLREAFGKVGEL